VVAALACQLQHLVREPNMWAVCSSLDGSVMVCVEW
jgi:hypothetical protein